MLGLLLGLGCTWGVSAAMLVEELRCESLENPEAINTVTPRLRWQMRPSSKSARGERQTAYQVLVASSLKQLQAGRGDLWNSGRVESDQSLYVTYQGRSLAPGQECFWKVRVWDQAGAVSAWSAPGRWRVGLLRPGDWQARWVGREETAKVSVFTGASWIWFPEGYAEKSAPIGTRYFRRAFELAADAKVKSARWQVTGDNLFTVYLNGVEVGTGGNFKTVTEVDLTGKVRAGRNVLAAMVKNVGDGPNPAGLAGLLTVMLERGEPLVVATDTSWQTTVEEFPQWQMPGYDDSTWLAARELGSVGMEPWGEVSAAEDRRLPARWLRKEFEAPKKLLRATAYLSGLGSSELYLNGRKVGDHVLSPGLTEYDKRAFYVAHDVTSYLAPGVNTVGVVLGNGRYWAPRVKSPMETRTYGAPRMLFQMKLEYPDGSSDMVISDDSWKLTTEGPIRANCEYDGEEYDACMELTGWSEPGFDDCKWERAEIVSPPGPVLEAQAMEPIRVTQTLKPIAIQEPQPGVFIVDMGQNLVGWCRLKVSGPTGTMVRLRHAETLKPDGTLYMDNIRLAKVTDTYVLKGRGREVYEPRFTYHGFRYVEVTGYPGKLTLGAIEGRVVHDDLILAGGFESSNDLLNQIYRNIIWGVRGNYRSIPTDCPQRDERQGWLGDRSAESKGETYLYDTLALYTKWLGDMADAQKPNGSVPDVCPSYWPIYSDNVTWPSSTVIIPATLYEQFGDQGPIAGHYESARKWVDYIWGFVTNGIIARDSYGDWCVPPEDPKLIHSNDPARKTDRALLATAYLYYDLQLMQKYAGMLGKAKDAKRFAERADELKQAFNARFFNAEEGKYDNGSQTSCVLPLAFGLVPEGQRHRVFDWLVRKITQESRNHIGTGLIGGQWLMRVLTENGRADLAYTIATQKDYPGWGYMIGKGATTIWELWNGDTADPAMNSGNHVMLVGDLGIWMYESLAGIKPDPQQPGFKHIVMRPEPVDGLAFVRASHRSPYGLIRSEWRRSDGRFHWEVTVPANTTATLHIPAAGADQVRESGRAAVRAKGVTFVGMQSSRAVFQVGSGTYRFEAR
ncbi:MAG TPA: family 78 glycoside hydrolase catalytic domain [Clostridia bacterium]|nr:family 78 glycoside hydrolase catalytic domain [Clostridia bacterium]